MAWGSQNEGDVHMKVALMLLAAFVGLPLLISLLVYLLLR